MTETELTARLSRTFAAQTADLTGDDYADAIDDAEEELEWSLPQTSNFRVKWLRERAIRHLMWRLCIGTARKFRVEGYHLHQRYKHYMELVVSMDKEFLKAVEDNAHEFAGVDAYLMFGAKIDAGFQYDIIGRDTTYGLNNKVIVEPLEG